MGHEQEPEARGSWVSYRPDIKILDCTIRDGGLVCDHHFSDEFVRAVYEADVEAGVDYMECGYKASKKIYPPSQYGPWKHCDEDDMRRVVGDNPTDLKLSVMADAERTDYKEDILPADESVFDTVRVAAYIHQIPIAMDMMIDAHEKGYEVLMQLMAVSVVSDKDLREGLDVLVQSPASAIYIVDSFGALYSEQVRGLTQVYMETVEGTGKDVGFHGHNNQQLAYANTIEALILGANRVDATMNGIGRGAGNCPLELLIGFLKNPKFRLRPVLKCIQDHVVPLKQDMEWGPKIPYNITGQLNCHPRLAIGMRSGDSPDDYVAFYDQMIEEG
ncbi:MAG: aldolase catalytic domain-containing protein [Planctomycetes bacterium]|nr:aldolase catalytic domain-containing protein [Planctomycetota bacterium]